MENEARKDQSENGDTIAADGSELDAILPLPWELCLETKGEKLKNSSIVNQEDELLKERVMALSLDETIFSGPFNGATEGNTGISFVLDESRVFLIRQLLEFDQNLGYIHARLSGESTSVEQNLH